MRIYRIYRELIHNDLKRDKANAIESIKRVQVENVYHTNDYLELREENNHLNFLIKRY